MKKQLLYLFFLTSVFSPSLWAQNTPALWKHTCNCGGMTMMTMDANQNTYVFNDGLNGAAVPTMLKLSPSGGQRFNNSYLPVGYTSMEFNNSIYKDGYIYIAGNVGDANTSTFDRLCLTKIDTLGNLIDQIVVDSIEVNELTGIKSAPYYSYGFFIDQSNNIHVAFGKNDASWNNYYSLLKFDLNFNLVAQFTDPLGLNIIPGPCYYLPDGTVYYSYSGSLSKLDNSYTSKVWTAPLSSPYTDARMIQADSMGNVFVLTAQIAGVFEPIFTLNSIADNGPTYVSNFDSLTATGSGLEFTQMLVDASSSSVFLSGYNTSGFPYRRYVTKQNSMTGEIIWRDSSYDSQFISDLLLSPQKNVIAIGGGTDYYVWLYDSQGLVDATVLYDGPCGANDHITAARQDASGKLIVTGTSCENASTINWGTTLKYNIPVITTGIGNPEMLTRLSVYPLPASSVITIQTNTEFQSLNAFDIYGRAFPLVMNEKRSVDVSSLPSGMYLVKGLSEKSVYECKMVVSH